MSFVEKERSLSFPYLNDTDICSCLIHMHLHASMVHCRSLEVNVEVGIDGQ